jgi:hypothetical protein
LPAADLAAGAVNLMIGANSVGIGELADNSADSASIVNGLITDADISETAAIADTKLATIATVGKVADTALSRSVSKLGSAIDTGELAGRDRDRDDRQHRDDRAAGDRDRWHTHCPAHFGERDDVVTALAPATVCSNLTATGLTVTGAAAGDTVSITPTAVAGGIETTNLSWMGYVSADDMVKIRACNPTAAPIDLLDTQTWRIDVWKH